MKTRKLLALAFALITASSIAFSQDDENKDERVLGEVTVTSKAANTDPVYVKFRNQSEDKGAFGGEYAVVNNLVIRKDAAVFTFRKGEIYFLQETEGRRTGAVFIGDGEMAIVPPVESEKQMLRFFIEESEVKEQLSEMVMFFTDKTFDEIKNSPNVSMSTGGPQANKARDLYRGKESLLKSPRFRYNMSTRILIDAYGPARPGFFWGFVDGKKHSNLLFRLDPLGVEEVAPEQVSLTNYDTNDYGVWLGFHLDSEYKKGTGNSNQDRRVFDITAHNIDITLRGLRMIATDEVTLRVLTKGQRVLPFNLFRHMRIKRVLNADGEELSFIQEDKEKDSDLAVILKKEHPVGEQFKIIFEYDGVESLTNEGTGNFILRSRTNWYPNNGGGGFLDRATFELKFRYPKNYVLIGVGELVDSAIDEGGLQFAHWSTKGVEMATAGFNYGDFRKHEFNDDVTGYELSVYNNNELPAPMKAFLNQIEQIEARRARFGMDSLPINVGSITTSSMAKTVLDEALNSVRLYDHYFGKLPHKRIAMTQQPRIGQGQAWATLVFMPYIAFVSDTHRNEIWGVQMANNEFWREVGPHEVAHQWWGHTVGWTSYRDQWMSEGFAELSASLYVQYVYKDTDRFIKYWEDQRKLIVEGTAATKGIKPYTVGPVTQGFRLISSKAPGAYRRMVYPKGAYILHMLRMMMIDPKRQGTDKDARFKVMMTDFIKSHYNQDVSTEDFKRIVEKHMPREINPYSNGSMDWFFNQWVYGTEMPKYELEYQIGSSKGQPVLNAKITQSSVSDNFVMPIPIYLDYGKGWVELGKATIVGNKTYELNNIPLPAKPKKVAVLALNDVLASSVKNNKLN